MVQHSLSDTCLTNILANSYTEWVSIHFKCIIYHDWIPLLLLSIPPALYKTLILTIEVFGRVCVKESQRISEDFCFVFWTDAKYARMLVVTRASWLSICVHTLATRHSTATSALHSSRSILTWNVIWEYTRGRSHSNVINVTTGPQVKVSTI